ncbi:MAG: DUF4079 domain-containing protein [Proteobacteria bacterium]|nr:DUF4079 domain-containing protein [Pseudomonadota bacterium]
MIPKEWLDVLRIGHGAYNALVAVAFAYQGWLGLKIRRERKAGRARDFDVVKKHRSRGPLLALLGILGYVAGAVLIYLDKGHFFEYPLHNLVGLGIVTFLTATFFIAREIKGPESPWRTRHGIVGIGILCLYLVQLFLGLNILL